MGDGERALARIHRRQSELPAALVVVVVVAVDEEVAVDDEPEPALDAFESALRLSVR